MEIVCGHCEKFLYAPLTENLTPKQLWLENLFLCQKVWQEIRYELAY
jgi:hypothetical protein